MRWSKLKQKIEDNFAPGLSSRVSINSARYGACSCGHVWISLDKEVIANFCTRANDNRYLWGHEDAPLTPDQIKRYKDQYVEYGDMSRQQVYQVCWDYVHDLAFDDAVQSEDPLVQSLMVLDKRLGKRRLEKLDPKALHPLAAELLSVRVSSMT